MNIIHSIFWILFIIVGKIIDFLDKIVPDKERIRKYEKYKRLKNEL